jgi:hypothetical protein
MTSFGLPGQAGMTAIVRFSVGGTCFNVSETRHSPRDDDAAGAIKIAPGCRVTITKSPG